MDDRIEPLETAIKLSVKVLPLLGQPDTPQNYCKRYGVGKMDFSVVIAERIFAGSRVRSRQFPKVQVPIEVCIHAILVWVLLEFRNNAFRFCKQFRLVPPHARNIVSIGRFAESFLRNTFKQ